MQNIYEKIDTMFSGQNDDRPQWACEILDELREIKELLKSQQKQTLSSDNIIQKQHNFAKYDFINKLRTKLKPDVQNDIFPYIIYNNEHYGVNFKGLINNQT